MIYKLLHINQKKDRFIYSSKQTNILDTVFSELKYKKNYRKLIKRLLWERANDP